MAAIPNFVQSTGYRLGVVSAMFSYTNEGSYFSPLSSFSCSAASNGAQLLGDTVGSICAYTVFHPARPFPSQAPWITLCSCKTGRDLCWYKNGMR